MAEYIKEGDKAPDIELLDQNENELSLDEFLGQWVILYFYPKDNTSGCTKEAKDFTASMNEIEEMGAKVIGVSPDSCQSHAKFVKKHDLKLRLLSDPDHQALEDYDVWKLKKMYGREYKGVERSTFLIDPEGIVRKVWRKVRVKGHVDEVKKTLKELM